MEQADLEIELGAWKKIAIDKQVLMSDVALALGLSAQCSNQELKDALNATIKKATQSEGALKTALDKASSASSELGKKTAVSEKMLAQAETSKAQAVALNEKAEAALKEAKDAKDTADKRIALARQANAEELDKVKTQVSEKQKVIQDVKKILADTPENVVKKLKKLKKEKFDESTARKAAETDARTLRKEKKQLEQDANKSQEVIDQAAEVVVAFREVNEAYNGVKAEDAEALTEIDDKILEAIENAATEKESDEEEKDSKKKDKKTKKKAK